MRYRVVISVLALVGLAYWLNALELSREHRGDTASSFVSQSKNNLPQSVSALRGPATKLKTKKDEAGVLPSASSVRCIEHPGIRYGASLSLTDLLNNFWSSGDSVATLGLSQSQLTGESLRDGIAPLRSAHYKWAVNGMPVVNSRISLFFDAYGELVFALLDTPPEGHPVITGTVSSEEAGRIASAAFSSWLSHRGVSSDGISLELNRGYSVAADGLRPIHVYRGKIPAPLWGEIEVIVDVGAGVVSSIKNISMR